MSIQNMRTSMSSAPRLTKLGKILLIVFGSAYILELILDQWLHVPVFVTLALWPVGADGFHFWQFLTFPLVHLPNGPLGFLLECLVFYFFSGTVEAAYGRGNFLYMFFFASLVGAAFAQVFSFVPGLYSYYYGISAGVTAMVTTFALLYRDATILLMFVIPVKARYLIHTLLVIFGLTILAKANPLGAFQIGGMAAAWIFYRNPKNLFDTNALYVNYLTLRLRNKKNKKERFTVIRGGRDDDDKPPTLH